MITLCSHCAIRADEYAHWQQVRYTAGRMLKIHAHSWQYCDTKFRTVDTYCDMIYAVFVIQPHSSLEGRGILMAVLPCRQNALLKLFSASTRCWVNIFELPGHCCIVSLTAMLLIWCHKFCFFRNNVNKNSSLSLINSY